MRRVVVTPAGRKKYLEILLEHMKREHDNSGFHQWDLWINTNVEEDIEYCRSLASKFPWIKTIELPGIHCVTNSNIHKFFKYACDPRCVYVRVDDDIVYIEPGFFDKLYTFRIANPEPFLVYANIINNAVISHIHQRNRRFRYTRLGGYKCMDDIGWKDPHYAETIHRAFIKDVKEGNIKKWHRSFDTWECIDFERVSINGISWLGRTFKEFEGQVGEDEEAWLSVDKPRMLNKTNVIFGGAICAHFAFFTQRSHLDTTDILDQYRDLTTKVINFQSLKKTQAFLFGIALMLVFIFLGN